MSPEEKAELLNQRSAAKVEEKFGNSEMMEDDSGGVGV